MSDALLSVRGLRVRFNDVAEAVRGVDIEVRRGETHCLVGESGCGKSVSALAVMGLLARRGIRTADQLQFAGQDIIGLDETAMSRLRGDKIAMIFQEPMTSLNPAYTVGSQMAEVLRRHRGSSRRDALTRAAQLLGRVGITAPEMRLAQYPHQLSGGLRQRVMIAMALMCDPDLLIADEPTTALDVTVQAQILRLLMELQRELGLAYHEIVGPFEQCAMRRREVRSDDFMQRKPGEQRQACRRRIAETLVNQRRAHEIARTVEPFAALTAAASGLAVGNQPVAFGNMLASAQARGEIGIGRAGFGDNLDQAAKNRAAAALSAMPPSHTVNR